MLARSQTRGPPPVPTTRGPQGPRGNNGLRGPQGLTGLHGRITRGSQGFVGKQGFQGKDGSVGRKGPQGLDGKRGQTGPQGPTIINNGPFSASGNPSYVLTHPIYPGNAVFRFRKTLSDPMIHLRFLLSDHKHFRSKSFLLTFGCHVKSITTKHPNPCVLHFTLLVEGDLQAKTQLHLDSTSKDQQYQIQHPVCMSTTPCNAMVNMSVIVSCESVFLKHVLLHVSDCHIYVIS